MTLTVNRSTAGSYCVVSAGPDHYLDARRNPIWPSHTFIEIVWRGQVIKHERVPNYDAPKIIVNLMRKGLLP